MGLHRAVLGRSLGQPEGRAGNVLRVNKTSDSHSDSGTQQHHHQHEPAVALEGRDVAAPIDTVTGIEGCHVEPTTRLKRVVLLGFKTLGSRGWNQVAGHAKTTPGCKGSPERHARGLMSLRKGDTVGAARSSTCHIGEFTHPIRRVGVQRWKDGTYLAAAILPFCGILATVLAWWCRAGIAVLRPSVGP
jgi:hypothetical protein